MLVSTTTASNRACRSKCCFRSCCLFFQLIKLMIQVKKESFRVNICLVFLMEFFNVIFQQLNLHTDASCHHKALIISENCIFMFFVVLMLVRANQNLLKSIGWVLWKIIITYFCWQSVGENNLVQIYMINKNYFITNVLISTHYMRNV